MAGKARELFVCVANAARSQMAEALLRHSAGDRFEAFSAGTAPTAVDPRTLEALQEIHGRIKTFVPVKGKTR